MELSKGEVRELNVVYFLSRNGRVEHPHLIRVHHRNRSGVRLRDVKRWLSELRGRGMPDSFAWSYKRRYKSGYIWRDLLDDDLITPISDNEFVLKGCELPRPLYEKAQKDDVSGGGKVPEAVEIEEDDEVSPPRPDEDSPGESTGRTAIFKIDISKEQEEEGQEEEREGAAAATATSKSRPTLQMFRSILTCRSSVETNDAALVPAGRRERSRERSYSGGKGTRKAGEAGGAAYRPAGAPNCSQCGKAFKPEKLHSHMKSCKALSRSRGEN